MRFAIMPPSPNIENASQVKILLGAIMEVTLN